MNSSESSPPILDCHITISAKWFPPKYCIRNMTSINSARNKAYGTNFMIQFQKIIPESLKIKANHYKKRQLESLHKKRPTSSGSRILPHHLG